MWVESSGKFLFFFFFFGASQQKQKKAAFSWTTEYMKQLQTTVWIQFVEVQVFVFLCEAPEMFCGLQIRC